MYRTESKQRDEILLPIPLQLLIVTTFNVFLVKRNASKWLHQF